MGKIIVENNVFIYKEADSGKILLDCNDLIANKSRIPMHSFDGDLTIPALVLNTMKEHEHLSPGNSDALEYLLLDILLISRLIQSPLPVKVLELGCMDGILSYHLATLLGKFHKDSLLCCVCDTIGNNSNNQWLDRISLVDEMPKLSLVVADYDNIQLAKNNFDIVIINGTVDFEEPCELIKDAETFLKVNGTLFCYADHQPLLESSFKLRFPERDEYKLNPWTAIMAVKHQKEIKDKHDSNYDNAYDKAAEYVNAVSNMAKEEIRREDLRKMTDKINGYIDRAIAEKDLDMKVNLIRQKERLIDFLVSLD